MLRLSSLLTAHCSQCVIHKPNKKPSFNLFLVLRVGKHQDDEEEEERSRRVSSQLRQNLLV